jgi:ribosomal protein L11 methyltransferase
MKEYIEIEIQSEDFEKLELLAAVMSDMGFHGIEETDTGIKLYAESDIVNHNEVSLLIASMELEYTQQILKEVNWNATWESNFEPVIIPGKIHIRADFHPKLDGFEHSIEITPKMSFGTGHHATTQLMMLEMLALDFKDKTVFDFGTGTGVLAILATQLGASFVKAVDNDDWSIENARENFERNNCQNIEISLKDHLNDEPTFDILLANINKHVLIEKANAMRRILKPGGVLIVSGLLSNDYGDIRKVFNPLFGEKVNIKEEKNWIVLRF